MPKTYLVPVDFSKSSEAALDYAIRLARDSNGKLLLVHVISDSALIVPGPEGGAADLLVETLRVLEEDAREAMKKLVRRRRLRPDKYRSLILRGGNPAQVIASQAKKARASMIVMGSHGRTGFQRLLLGSVAERTLRYAGCPVLIIKKKK